jgi:hypothetical protein
MATTPTKQLASVALGVDVIEWVIARRDTPAKPSFRTIADDLRIATGGRVAVTDETIRLWYLGVVCTCDEPDVDGIGMCRTCKRKPAELLRRPA